MALLVMVSVAVLTAVGTLRWNWLAATVCVLFAVFVPAEWLRSLAMPYDFPPSSLVAASSILVLALVHPRTFLAQMTRAFPRILVLGMFSAVALAETLLYNPAAVGFLVNTVIAPILVLGVVQRAGSTAQSRRTLRVVIVGAAAIEVALAAGVKWGVLAQPYEEQLSLARWYSDDGGRATGTMGHPLQLALLLVIAAALLTGFRSALVRLSLGSVFVFGSTLTESRSGLFLTSCVFVWVIIASTTSIWSRAISVMCGAAALFLIASSGAAAGVLDKFADDNGSAGARISGAEWLSANAGDFAVIGHGSGSSRSQFGSTLGLSLENPFAAFSVDFGLVPTIGFFLTILITMTARHSRPAGSPGTRMAGFFALAHVLTFSSIAVEGNSAALLWIAVGLASPWTSLERETEDKQSERHVVTAQLPEKSSPEPSCDAPYRIGASR